MNYYDYSEDDHEYEESYEEQYIEEHGDRNPNDFGMYLTVVDSFRMHWRKEYNKMRSWRPIGRFDIEVTLNDGTRWHYDFFKHSLRCIARNPEDKSDRNKEAYRKEFGRRLKVILKDNMVTQRMLSDMTGISENTISSYIRGVRSPEVWAIKAIANAIPCSPLELIDFE